MYLNLSMLQIILGTRLFFFLKKGKWENYRTAVIIEGLESIVDEERSE